MKKYTLKTITKKEIDFILNSTDKLRTKLLILMIYETGLKIHEILSLQIEDIKCIDNKNILSVVNRNGNCIERNLEMSDYLYELYCDYKYDILDEFKNNKYVFIKLQGKNKGQKCNYKDIACMFNTVSIKNNIDISPSILRHSFAINILNTTKNIQILQHKLGHSQLNSTIKIYFSYLK